MITTHSLRILNIPFSLVNYEKENELIAAEMSKADIVHLTLNAIRYLTQDNIPIAISLISRLVFTTECSKNFAQQFVQGGGLATVAKYKLLCEESSVNLIVDSLSLISQLARISKDFYEPIHNANIYTDLKVLIGH
jgi:fused-like protein